MQPTSQPSFRPSGQPSSQPTAQPSGEPSAQPSMQPSGEPTCQPSNEPSSQPSGQPSSQPSKQPNAQPSGQPSVNPSGQPTIQPSGQPSEDPSGQPTMEPSGQPISQPTSQPTGQPSDQPSGQPSDQPSEQPTNDPTSVPSELKYLDFTPNIVSMSHSLDTSILQINVTVEAPCAVYCGLFRSSEIVSATRIRAQKRVFYAVGFDAEISIVTFIPNVIYSVYCMTTTLDGKLEMSLASILDTHIEIDMPCCRGDLTIDVSSKYMAESQYLQDSVWVYFDLDLPIANEVRILIDVLPISFFVVNETVLTRRYLNAYDSFEDCAGRVFVDPTFMSITSTAFRDIRRPIRIASSCPGTFYINISAVEIDSDGNSLPLTTVFPNHNIIDIFPTNNSAYQFMEPELLTAAFVSDGDEIELRFDSPTNKAGLGGIYFTCNLTMRFSGASSTLCYWKSSTRLRIYRNNHVLLGDNITLLGGIVASDYDPKVYASFVTRSLGMALTSLPSVVVTSPSYISSCAWFSLDLTASTGSGGRPWKVTKVTVKTGRSPTAASNFPLNANVSQINSFFENDYLVSESTRLPAGILVPNQIYFFRITLCNFLDKCAHYDHRLEVEVLPITTVYLQGDEHRDILRTESVRFKAVPISNCNGTEFSSTEFKTLFSPVYIWRVFNLYNQTIPILTVTRVNQFTSTLTLSPYTLSSGNEYKVVVLLKTTFDSVVYTSQGIAYLTVSTGPLNAVLSSVGHVSIRYGEVLMLNASESFDANVGENRNVLPSSTLSATWSCALLDAAKFDLGCGSLLTHSSQWTMLVNSTQGGYVGALYIIELTVTPLNTADTRISTVALYIYIEADCCSKLSLPPIGLVNTQEVVTIEGFVATSLNGVAKWEILESALELNSIAMGPISTKVFTFYPIFTTIGSKLLIAPNTLSPGTSYIFQLVYNSNNGQDFRSGTVTVITNDVPRSGIFTIFPVSGVELQDKFTLSATQWSDSHLPLMYHFGYYSVNDKAVTLKAKNEDNYIESVLPRGHPISHNASLILNCFLETYDFLGAFVTRTRGIIVNGSALNASELDTLYSILANETESNSDNDVIDEVVDIHLPAAVIIINCSMAPDCMSLNREPCSNIAHTCGTCFPGNFLGQAGDANTFCYNNTVNEEGVEHCFEDASCGQYRECLHHTCTRISKPCTVTCLLNGACAFRDDASRQLVDNCFLDDFGCSSFCMCEVGFNGPECDIPGIFYWHYFYNLNFKMK